MVTDTDELIRQVLALLAEDCVPDEAAANRLHLRIFGKEVENDEQE